MPCRTCIYWHADEQPEKSMRGYCGNARADKSGNRTVFDYSCREHTSRPTPVAPDAAIALCPHGNRVSWCAECEDLCTSAAPVN